MFYVLKNISLIHRCPAFTLGGNRTVPGATHVHAQDAERPSHSRPERNLARAGLELTAITLVRDQNHKGVFAYVKFIRVINSAFAAPDIQKYERTRNFARKIICHHCCFFIIVVSYLCINFYCQIQRGDDASSRDSGIQRLPTWQPKWLSG